MCGIFGIIAKKGDVAEKMLIIGKRLAYRGYRYSYLHKW